MDNRAIIASCNVNSFNTTITDDRNQVLQWLSPLEPQKRHQHLRENRLEGVGQWIFQTNEFRRWDTREDGSSHSVLFCHGDPGVGKTHLSSVVIDHFYDGGRDTATAGLYCDYLDRNEQTTSNMLGVMLKQLVGSGSIPEDIRKAFEGAKERFGGVGPRVPELLNMLKTAIAQRQRVVICIDGLDESIAAHRTGLLRALQGIVRELPNVRLFITGRPFIRSEVEKCFPGVDTISISPTKEDTEAFLRIRLDEDLEPDAMDERLREDIMEIIPKRISEIFLLVSLSIEAILAETTINRRREKLKQMSSGQDVGDVYAATLERISAQEKGRARLGMEAIMWVAYSERPLKPDELCQALGVGIGTADLESDNVPSIRTILSCGLGLITVDSSSSVARLVHFTLQEHIQANPTIFLNSHSMIGEVCLTYLNFGCIRDLSPALGSPPSTAPFLEYASLYWGAHARRQTSTSVISLALKLLDGFDEHISCELLLRREFQNFQHRDVLYYDGPIKCTALHAAAFLGVLEIMVSLLKINKWDVNAISSFGVTALTWATRVEHDAIVKVLLEQGGVNSHIVGPKGKTLLSYAAEHGSAGVVEMLLERNDVNPDITDEDGRTPLSWAASMGDWRKSIGEGYERVVKILLERNEVNPDSADGGGRTPLSWAAGPSSWLGDEGEPAMRVIEILLKRNDVNPNSADKSGRTPLSQAAENGRNGPVKALLGHNNVDPNISDKSGRTPLSWAAAAGLRSEGPVRMLLEQNSVDPDGADKSGRTPLSWAAENGCEKVVQILLARDDVNPDTADEDGRTPLSWAVGLTIWPLDTEEGYRRIANILSGQSHPNLFVGDSKRYKVAKCEGVVRLLLGRKEVGPDSFDKSGRTPLSWAAGGRCEGVVGLLLQQNNVDPNRADKSGRTPLSWAAGNGCEKVVQMLLARHDVNPDTANEDGRTPLSWAAGLAIGSQDAEEGYEMVVGKLLCYISVDLPTAGAGGRALPSWATGLEAWQKSIEKGYERVVKILLRNEVNPNIADKSGRTPLSWATENGGSKIMEMLSQWNNAYPDMVAQSGQTPFSCATGSGTEGVTQGQTEPHGLLSASGPVEELSEPFAADSSPVPEPPLKKTRRF